MYDGELVSIGKSHLTPTHQGTISINTGQGRHGMSLENILRHIIQRMELFVILFAEAV